VAGITLSLDFPTLVATPDSLAEQANSEFIRDGAVHLVRRGMAYLGTE
jgi:hypothetical protein